MAPQTADRVLDRVRSIPAGRVTTYGDLSPAAPRRAGAVLAANAELILALEAARDDGAVRCVVLTSTHQRVFSAGGNTLTGSRPTCRWCTSTSASSASRGCSA